MAFFQHLELFNHKGLKRVKVNDLRKINVICGPNNSGKTSVLEAILGSATSTAGWERSDYLIEQIAKGVVLTQGQLDVGYLKALLSKAWRTQTWTKHDHRTAWNEVNQISRTTGQGIAVSHSVFSESVERVLSERPTVVLIPAKRKLDATVNVNTGEGITPEGGGVLNFLFFARNQDARSEMGKYFHLIDEGFRAVTGGCKFEIYFEQNNKVALQFRQSGGDPIAAENCGLGLRDVLIILYFAIASKFEVVLIEEPEIIYIRIFNEG